MLDLGSGSGRDCYAAAALVGESGRVTGVDMTAEQLATARKHSESFCKSLGTKRAISSSSRAPLEKAQIQKRPISGALI